MSSDPNRLDENETPAGSNQALMAVAIIATIAAIIVVFSFVWGGAR